MRDCEAIHLVGHELVSPVDVLTTVHLGKRSGRNLRWNYFIIQLAKGESKYGPNAKPGGFLLMVARASETHPRIGLYERAPLPHVISLRERFSFEIFYPEFFLGPELGRPPLGLLKLSRALLE